MNKEKYECFVIMPISDSKDYENGHFNKIYRHIIKPAVQKAGFKAVRADDIKHTNLIIHDIVHRLLTAPMAICDLSSRNPNVLYELGLRHAFNMPVLLIKDDLTKHIFDVDMFRHVEYPSCLNIGDDKIIIPKIKDALKETYAQKDNLNNINSIVNNVISNVNNSKRELDVERIQKILDDFFYRLSQYSPNCETIIDDTIFCDSTDNSSGNINNSTTQKSDKVKTKAVASSWLKTTFDKLSNELFDECDSM